MPVIQEMTSGVGIQKSCQAVNVPRASYYRWMQPEKEFERNPPPLALLPEERQGVLEVLHEGRFIDLSPWQVYARLLDESTYLCSVRTMYRILDSQGEVRERRNQLIHPAYQKPELLATAPNQVWSWDITKLKGPVKWTFYYLYVILDLYSRYVVGWMVAHQESAILAKKFIEESCQKQQIEPGQLLIHSDRGPSMTSKSVALLLSDLGVTKSLSRPYVSDDNPFSEAQFKTLKYRPEFPNRFGSMEDSREFCRAFFPWYNEEHYHSGIGFLRPADVHYGRADQILKERQQVLAAAFEKYPNRFKGRMPKPADLPEAVWINKPKGPATDPELH
jgi:putative transposase